MSSFADLEYHQGFGNHFCSEALPNALPSDQNSPQVCNYGLYAEQLSGTAFTAPRAKNQRSWLYRIRPSVLHSKYRPFTTEKLSIEKEFDQLVTDPNQLRWNPLDLLEPVNSDKSNSVDFVKGLKLYGGVGHPTTKEGLAIYQYTANDSMINSAFYSADGDFLIVPQEGVLYIVTEFGKLVVEPCEIVVIPRGVKFAVQVNEPIRGYVAEVFNGHFELPGLGPIGANGLANPRDFRAPKACFEDVAVQHTIIAKYMQNLFVADLYHSPFDVVAWHGNYVPYKYDLRKFNTINSVSFDHPDPSIFTVLTCPSNDPGTAVLDFVIFPPRWMVTENSFRPPYFHRNCMSEFMGLIYGKYDGKAGANGEKTSEKKGFIPGGASLHSCMTAHGPDAVSFMKASQATLQPTYFNDGLAFMFESTYMLKVAPTALQNSWVQEKYAECWQRLPKLFDGTMNPSINWEALADAAVAPTDK